MSELLHINAYLEKCQPDEKKMLNMAIERCRNLKVNLTPIRQVVMLMVARSATGLKAYALLESLKLLAPSAVPQTVYRALNFLIKAGLIMKISSCQTFKICPLTDSASSQALLICPQCNKQAFITEGGFYDEFTQLLQLYAFSGRTGKVEIVTLCNLCAPE